ncbi:NADH-quinone oxidoreductase subunit H [Escherichia coli]
MRRCSPVLPAWREPAYITVVGRVCCRSIVTLSNCWGCQSVGPDASGWVFRLTPYVMVGVMLTIATALPVVTVGLPLPQLGDLITLLYLFAIARSSLLFPVWIPVARLLLIGASREAMLGVLVEPMPPLGLWVAAQVAGSTNISNITHTVHHWPRARASRWCWRFAPCVRHFYRNGKPPFDLAEAEQELQEGPLSETAVAALAS